MTLLDRRGAADMLAGMAGRVSSPVFVGRQAEIEAIEAALDRAGAGQAVHLLVAGEAGVGKTRFTAEVARIARDRGFRVLRGECGNVGGSSLPYGPLVEALRGLANDLDPSEIAMLAGPAAADLARLVPSFGSTATTAPAQSEWVQSRLFEGLLGLLTRLSARSPVLLVLEDLHWADAATRETIAFLVRALAHVPVVVVGTYRTDELHRRHPLLPWLAELERGGRVERVELARFDQARLGTLIAAILGTEPGPDVVADVFDRSDGNPFFAEELLAARQPGQAGPRLPPTLREILLAHIASAPESAHPVLGVAAVAGRRVEHDLLARVAGLPEVELLDGLRAAVGGNLLVIEVEDGVERYAFRHALVQEVAYDELLPGERRVRHRAFAEALEAQDAGTGMSEVGQLAELAHHWAAAREDARAFEASVRAGEAAISSFAFGAALQEYERALELWDGLTDPADVAGFDRVELLRRAGLAAYLAADYRRAVAHRRGAIAAADTVADPVRAGLLREELGRALWVIGDTHGSLAAYRDAVEAIPVDPPTAERARALSGLGQILMLRAHYQESRDLCAEAIAIARTVGARAQEGHALNTYGNDLAALGDCSGGTAALREALEIAREVRNADDIGRAYVNLTEETHDCGDSATALAVTYEGIRSAEELGIGLSYGYYIRLGGVSYAYALGRWDEAERLLTEAIARGPSGMGAERYRLSESLRLLVSQGSAAADAGLERAYELIDDVSEAQFMGPIHTAGAERELWRHAPRLAMALIERALDSLVGTDDQVETAHLCRFGAWAAADLADEGRAAHQASATAEARSFFERLDADLARVEAAVLGDGMRRELAADRATLDAESSRLDGIADPAAWAGVADAWEELERPYVAAYARWREAEAAILGGDRATAATALQASLATATRLGAEPMRGALEALGRRARISSTTVESPDDGPVADADPFGLTPREREVLTLVADGRTNRQIAETLFISESTAGVHVSNILGKLGVANRVEAAAVAFRLELTSAEPGSRR